jgi:UPF0042 nucleotide-binding protein
MRLIIISGRSGSGKSICLDVLEDLGFYCIDNLPLKLLPAMIDELQEQYKQIAVSIDARTAAEFDKIDDILQQLDKKNIKTEIYYLDARDKTLLTRFNSTRRKHPLTNKNTSLSEAIQKEHKLLLHISQKADLHLETDNYTVHHFRDLLRNRISNKPSKLTLLFQSFSYKIGIPSDSDYVFDVRCLPNPYWEMGLREYTGLDEPVKTFLSDQSPVKIMLKDIQKFLSDWIPQFKLSDRTYITIAIGCTGGRHRSVYIAECLAKIFESSADEIQIRHTGLPS